MKLPRDLDGAELVRVLQRVGYRVSRQHGSHVRLTLDDPSEHHVTIPMHSPLRIGTLAAVIADVAMHFGIERDALLERLFR